jgi:arginyl-tRNA synthetase
MKHHFTPKEYVQNALKSALAAYAPDYTGDLQIESKGNRDQFGDFSSTVAFSLASLLKKSPLEIAKEIASSFPPRNDKNKHGYIEKAEAAGNGFINFFVSPELYIDAFKHFKPNAPKLKKEKLIIEFSSPNVAKPIHVGHLRNTILGEFLCRLHEAAGHNVIRWNHLGDWGTQFGKLIVAYKKWGDRKKVDKNPITELLALYVRFTQEAKQDDALEDEARKEFHKLEHGDTVNKKLLDWFLKETMKELSAFYKKLDSRFDVVKGESFYVGGKEKLFKQLAKKNLLQKSEGATILELDGLPPVLLEKSDGATLYHTRDILSLQYRIKKYHPDRILYVVGSEQELHLRQLFAAAEKIGISGIELAHVSYGIVLGKDRKKLSTREGNIITAQDLLRDAIFKAAAIMHEKHPDAATIPPAKTVEKIALGAVKYNMLKESRGSDVVFDFDAMLSFAGNSAPYIQYTYARVSKILSKAKSILPSLKARLPQAGSTSSGGGISSDDLAIIKKLLAFPDALAACLELLSSHPLTDYLFSLANELNTFYEKNPILKDTDAKRKKQRLYMLKKAAETLAEGLRLLGIEAPEAI